MVSVGGGHSADAGISPGHHSLNYPPRYLGTRPSYGLFLRRAKGVTLTEVDLSWAAADGRPPIIISDVDGVSLGKGMKVAAASPPIGYDIGLRGACTGVTTSPGSQLVLRNITAAPDW